MQFSAFTALLGGSKEVCRDSSKTGRRNNAIAATLLALTVASCTTAGENAPEADLSSVALVDTSVKDGRIVSVDDKEMDVTVTKQGAILRGWIVIKPGPHTLQITNIGPEKEYRGSDFATDAALLVLFGMASAVPENIGPRTLLSCSTIRFEARAGRTYQVIRASTERKLYLKDTKSNKIIASASVPDNHAGRIAGGTYVQNILADNPAYIHGICPQLSSVSDRPFRKMSCSRLAGELNSKEIMPADRARNEAVKRAMILNKCKPAGQG